MPVAEGAATDRHRLVRSIRVVRGPMRFAIEIQPRFDYGRAAHKLELTDSGGVFQSDGLELTVHGIAPQGTSIQDAGVTLERAGDGVRWTRTLREGDIGGVVLESMGGAPRLVPPEEAQRLADETALFWRSWLHRSSYTGRWREMVARSAITLKLMTYAPTGALVAAPTTGLPEQEGGERNWDYRYTWVRDGSFSIYGLLSLGYTEEAAAFGAWLRDRAAEQAGHAYGPLKIMYRVDGTSDLVEESLEHWGGRTGGAGAGPGRSGSGTAPPTSCSWTSTARPPTRSSWPTATASRSATRAGPSWPASSTGCASTGTSRMRTSGKPAAARRTSPTGGSR